MLVGALLATSTGLQAASTFLDAVSNNVANASTPGFKTGQVTFQDLLSIGTKPGATATQGTTAPGGTQVGSGAIVDSVTGLFTQGGLEQTGRQLDFAIDGQGFFSVTRPDGSTGYTRAGNFNVDASGKLVTSDGFQLAGGITIPANASSVSVSSDGTVTATTPAGTRPIGNLTLTRFQNPAGLTRIGSTTFAADPASGAATTGAPGANGTGAIVQGSLEQSNVDLTSELVNLIVAQRAFQFNTRALQVENETLQATTALIS